GQEVRRQDARALAGAREEVRGDRAAGGRRGHHHRQEAVRGGDEALLRILREGPQAAGARREDPRGAVTTSLRRAVRAQGPDSVEAPAHTPAPDRTPSCPRSSRASTP